MTEAAWLAGTDFSALLGFVETVLSPRRERLLAVAFCRGAARHIPPHPVLSAALDVYDQFADGAASAADIEKARQACRAVAQAAYEEYRTAVDEGTGDGRRGYVWAEFAWAAAYSANGPVPLDEIGTRAASAARYARAWAAGEALDVPGELVVHTGARGDEARALCAAIRDTAGNPFRAVAFSPEWRTSTVLALARQMYEAREFSAMPILADALQDAGCDSDDVLNHCREPGDHVRGCWVCDLVLSKS